jgi:hypothetical protein
MNIARSIDSLNYLAIPEEVAAEARATMRDRFGHDVQRVSDTGPCRVCLRIAQQPEELLLLSYRPLPDAGPYAEIGPIFIHAQPCEPYASTTAFPEDFAQRPSFWRMRPSSKYTSGTSPTRALLSKSCAVLKRRRPAARRTCLLLVV